MTFVNKSHNTAIKRKALSAPVRYLKEAGLLKGRILDYGCGRGFDADALGAEGYDPYYRNRMPGGKFDVVLCIYVLNVLTPEMEIDTLVRVSRKLSEDGKAYVAVRRDVKVEGYTSKRTYQRNVELQPAVTRFRAPPVSRAAQLEWKILYERKGAFCIYESVTVHGGGG